MTSSPNARPKQLQAQTSSQPQILQVTPNGLQNVSGGDSTRTIIASGPNTLSCEPSASIPFPSPRHDHQPLALTMFTPGHFEKQKQRENKQLSPNASKIIESIREVVKEGFRKPEYYAALWDNIGNFQTQGNSTDPIRRYDALKRMIDVSTETEAKCIYTQRIAHILGDHELGMIENSVLDSELSPGVGRRTLAINKLASSLGRKREQIIKDTAKHRHYFSFYSEIGPGAIILLGHDTKNL
ncbi:hypothetical protein BDW59DRAFT_177064 [Aspergillus cavernicola]|uniref:Uncharacterized protein n=1 Tax=Aspergillus cavernicola TaxID=176166 RepID=A0ABR4H8F2_9EURO